MFVVCHMKSEWDKEQDESVYSVYKPLQAFATKEEAEKVRELFNPYYNYDLDVIPASDM